MLSPSPTPSTTPESERRGTPRYHVDLAVRFWRGEHAGPPEEGQLRDVSWGGLFVETAAALERGAPLTLEVSMPQHRDPVPLRGHVVWVSAAGAKGAGIGIKLCVAL
jgi:hypothetical protein